MEYVTATEMMERWQRLGATPQKYLSDLCELIRIRQGVDGWSREDADRVNSFAAEFAADNPSPKWCELRLLAAGCDFAGLFTVMYQRGTMRKKPKVAVEMACQRRDYLPSNN